MALAPKRSVCFVTGARSEFGLMQTTLRAIREHPGLRLQIIVTGMHLDPAHGEGMDEIAGYGFGASAVVPWPAQSGRDPAVNAVNTGSAIAGLARAFARLRSDIVLVTGDRTEAFAAAAAGHLSHRVVAHIHGGDRALGQVDDSLRHAITKLAHIHFPATAQSARRIARLGEQPWRIHRVGAPGIDDIHQLAAPWMEIQTQFPALRRGRYALVVLHPADPDAGIEHERAAMLLDCVSAVGFEHTVIIYPNNDPGSAGIIRCWRERGGSAEFTACRCLARPVFLGLMRDAAVLAGNSSSGIIEAASFQTPVLDIGPRQAGRERSRNVIQCGYDATAILRHLRRVWNSGQVRRPRCRNVYQGTAGRRIADILGRISLDERLLKKLIRY
jgi:UDP-hydrolysing UDP-N-acetyl-D-glucosamine 2-epimerase